MMETIHVVRSVGPCEKKHSYSDNSDDLEIFHLGKHNKRFLEQLPKKADTTYRLVAISLSDRMLWTINLTKTDNLTSINIQGPRNKRISIESSEQEDFFLSSLLQVLDVNNLRLFHWLDQYALSNWGLEKED